jgi:outer membrane protein assembly factor BamB
MLRKPLMPAAAATLLLALALLAPDVGGAAVRVLTIDTASAKPKVPFEAFDAPPVKAFDFDGDGDLEILAHNDNRYVYVFDSKTGKLLAELLPTYPPGWGARPLNGPEAAMLVKGGMPHIILVNSAAYVTDWVYAGKNPDGTFKFDKLWERRLTECNSNPSSDGKPTLADLDGDGDLEILVHNERPGAFALDRLGNLVWHRCVAGGNADPGAGDLDGDGGMDAVFVSDGGLIIALDGKTGATKWQQFVGGGRFGLGAGAMPIGPTVARLDADASADVVVAVRDSSDCTDFFNNHAALVAIRGNGELMWVRQHFKANPLTYAHPIVVDLVPGQLRDVFWGDWNTQGKSCGNWEPQGPANFYRYRADGKLEWWTELNSWWSNDEQVLCDCDGDGQQEMLAVASATAATGCGSCGPAPGPRSSTSPSTPGR